MLPGQSQPNIEPAAAVVAAGGSPISSTTTTPIVPKGLTKETTDGITATVARSHGIDAAERGAALAGGSAVEALLTLEEIESDWRLWLKGALPAYCEYDWAPHQSELWDFVWKIEDGVKPAAFVGGWCRGHGKSTSIENAVLMLAARNRRTYCLYVCETQEQADKHVQDIGARLESDRIEHYYDALARRRVNKYKHSKGWKRDRLVTDHGLVVDSLGLDVAARGIKFENQRPDIIIFDDVDNEGDSPAMIAKKIRLITKKIIPAGSRDVAVFFMQNLIHEDSIVSMLFDGRADFLNRKKKSGPIPALRGFSYETYNDEDGNRLYKVAGEPTWAGMDLEACNYWINEVGLTAFLTEFQHDVKVTSEGAVYPEWSEIHHLITYSEFMRVYGRAAQDHNGQFQMPRDWNCGCGQDWGTTVLHPCVTLWASRPNENLTCSDSIFFYRELVRPFWPSPKGKLVDPISPHDIAELIKDAERAWVENERMTIRVMSHEQTAAQATYVKHEELAFAKWTPDRVGGIAQVQNFLDIDRSKPHPFRRDPKTGEAIMGRPKLYFIVPDDQGSLYYDAEGKLKVKGALDSRGFIRTRWEKPRYKYPATASGGERDRPDALHNDAMDAERGLAKYFFMQPRELDDAERYEDKLNERLKADRMTQDLPTLDPQTAAQRVHARMIELERIKEREAEEEAEESDDLDGGGHFILGGSVTRGD
jgi:hypothetical protein